jgi:hypothetical protein
MINSPAGVSRRRQAGPGTGKPWLELQLQQLQPGLRRGPGLKLASEDRSEIVLLAPGPAPSRVRLTGRGRRVRHGPVAALRADRPYRGRHSAHWHAACRRGVGPQQGRLGLARHQKSSSPGQRNESCQLARPSLIRVSHSSTLFHSLVQIQVMATQQYLCRNERSYRASIQSRLLINI